MKSKDILAIALTTMITVFAWIGFQTYRTIATKPIPSKAEQLVKPINPTVREDVLQKLEQAQPLQ